MNVSLDSIEKESMGYTFCNGIAGIIWGFCHLVEIGIIESNLENVIGEEIDTFLSESAKENIKKGNYDYLHGGGGPILYLLNRT